MADREYLGGLTHTTLHFESDGTLHVEEKQDCEPILEYAKAARNHRYNADACDGMLRHEAEIPMVVYIAECRRIGARPFTKEADQAINNIVNDPMYSLFKTAPKTVDPHIIIKGAR